MPWVGWMLSCSTCSQPVCVVFFCLDGTQDRGRRAGGRRGAVPQEGHTSSAFNPALGAMGRSQDGDPRRGYSIGEAVSVLWRIRDAVRLSWADQRRAVLAACCQGAARLDLSSWEES